jgi:phosphoribosylformylglycinamidine cyclo-ligase
MEADTLDEYSKLGVSSSKAGLHKALAASGTEDKSGLFAQVIPDLAGSPDYSCFVHCDGAGTKCIVPYLYWKETGDKSLFANLAQDALVMNLDDVFCIGLPQSMVLANLVARNASIIDDEILEILIRSYKTLVEGLQKQGIEIRLSGGETADCGDTVRTLLVDAVLSGRIENKKLINTKNIKPGDVIVGLSSTGKSIYEDKANSGIGSNGLTLARHALLKNHLRPEVENPELDKNNIYRGSFSVKDKPEGLGMSVGEALASPTRTYAPFLKALYEEAASAVTGAIHCTGGGQTKVKKFGEGNLYVKDNLFPTPKLFSLIQESGKIPWKEMYQVFNMGHRMEVYLKADAASAAIKLANKFGIDAKEVGRVEKAEQNSVLIKSEKGEFKY